MQIQTLDSRRDVGERADDAVYRFSPAILRLPGVTAALAYLAPSPERPYYYMYGPPAGTARENCEYQVSPVWIKDARAMMALPPSIHVEGFELWDAPKLNSVRATCPEENPGRRFNAKACTFGFGIRGDRHVS